MTSIRLVSLIRDRKPSWEESRGASQNFGWTLSEAGFAGFWEIFGIAGERLMVGRRVFFAAGERADCLKQDLQDFGRFSGLRASG